jgi:hypothetical protein
MLKFKNTDTIKEKHLKAYKMFCRPNSAFFSNSQEYIHGYINPVNTAWCYYDKLTIFFFGPFASNMYFIASPKGENWEKKVFELISYLRFSRGVKLFKLIELQTKISDFFLKNSMVAEIKYLPRPRYLTSLSECEDIESYCSLRPKIKKKIRNFKAKCRRQQVENNITFKPLTWLNYIFAKKVVKEWKQQAQAAEKELFPGEIGAVHVYNKNICLIKRAVKFSQNYESLLMYCKSKPIGIILGFKIEKSNSISGSVLCVNRVISNASCILCLEFMQMLAKKGYSFMNWGNSFSEEMAKFKKQFYPMGQETAHEYILKLV